MCFLWSLPTVSNLILYLLMFFKDHRPSTDILHCLGITKHLWIIFSPKFTYSSFILLMAIPFTASDKITDVIKIPNTMLWHWFIALEEKCLVMSRCFDLIVCLSSVCWFFFHKKVRYFIKWFLNVSKILMIKWPNCPIKVSFISWFLYHWSRFL